MLLHSCQLDNNKEYTPKTFTSSLTWFSHCTRLYPVLPFLLSSSLWVLGAPAVFICSVFGFFSNVVEIQSSTAVVVVWMKCPALVTRTLKHPYFKKTPITSAGMSRQAMSTTATVGCLNSCYTRFSYHICVSSCLVATLHRSPCCRSSTSLMSFSLHQLRRRFSGLMVI